MRPTAAKREDPWCDHRKVLAIADVQSGYHHDSISHALATLERIGRDHDAFRTEMRTDSQLVTKSPILGVGPKYGGRPVNARNLDDFDALFLLPSGAGTLNARQKADLLAFVHEDGKGLVVGHAALVAFFDWPEWGELLGARMRGESSAPARVIVERPEFPGAQAFGRSPFVFEEQHAILSEPLDREIFDVILRLDPESLGARERERRPEGDFPVLWTRRYGKGRICSLTWGHEEETWDDPRFQELVLGMMRWAMGDAR